MPVVTFHVFPTWLSGGFIGVDIFFVISGFLISTLIFENLERDSFSLSEFFARRIQRILPALLLILISSYTFGWFALLADEYKQLAWHTAAGAGLVSNFILWREAGYFDNLAETKPLLHLWSLSIEEQFYLIWPFALWLAWKKRFNLFILTIVVAVVSFALNVRGIEKDSVATFYSPLTRFWELMCGSILAWFTFDKTSSTAGFKLLLKGYSENAIYRLATKNNGRMLSNISSFAGFFILTYGFVRITKDMSFPGLWAVIPVLGSVLIILAGPKAWINRKILSHQLAVWLGLISFPLYLWHWPLLSFTRIAAGEAPSPLVRIVVVLLSIMLAWLTYKFVERPLRRGAHSKQKVFALLMLLFAIASVGYNTSLRDGFRFRRVAQNSKQFRMDLLKEEGLLRQTEIRVGACHFNEALQSIDIESFVANWNCFSDDEGLKNTKALFFGDSHAADKSMALRTSGFDVVQIGGVGCSINPHLATDQRNYCRFLFDLVKRNDKKYETVFLSHSFPMSEINVKNLLQIFKYWSGSKPVFLFTPMPDFTSQMNDFLKSGKISSPPDFSREDAFLAVVKNMDLPHNFQIIKTSDLWCLNRTKNETYPCAFANKNELLMIDGRHLSARGAKIFGQNMLVHSVLKSTLRAQ